MSGSRVAVVGAGLAGLAAALDLKASGAAVDLFERSRLLGGRATSFELDGVEVDNGQHVFLGCCTEFIGFARRVGMESHLHLQEHFEALVIGRDGRKGRLRTTPGLPPPLHLAPSFLGYPHLGLSGKLRIARALVAALGRPSPAEQTQTFEAWLQAMGQDAATREGFWDPFFIPALNAPYDCVSAQDALFVLRTAFLGDPGAARFGFSTVPLAHFAKAAAERLDAVHLSTGVVAVTPGDGGLDVSLLGGGQLRYDAVVLAVPPKTAAKLLGDPARFGVAGLDRFEPFPILDVHLWHDGDSLGFDFAAALGSPLQWIFEKAPGYVCCSFSAAQQYLRMTTAELQELAWNEVRAYLPALREAKLIRAAVTRNPDATYLPLPGCARPGQATNDPRLAIAGAWTCTGWPDTMESAVRSGYAAAKALGAPARTLAQECPA